MAKRAYRLVDGRLEEIEKAAPEHLREDLRNIPSDLVTKDIGDPDRVHELDPPHILNTLVDEAEERDMTPSETKEEVKPRDTFVHQATVDAVRLRVLKAWIVTQKERIEFGQRPDFGVKHLWFETNNIDRYVMRDGNPPADSERPKHLRGIHLEIDITCIPETIQRRLAANVKLQQKAADVAMNKLTMQSLGGLH